MGQQNRRGGRVFLAPLARPASEFFDEAKGDALNGVGVAVALEARAREKGGGKTVAGAAAGRESCEATAHCALRINSLATIINMHIQCNYYYNTTNRSSTSSSCASCTPSRPTRATPR